MFVIPLFLILGALHIISSYALDDDVKAQTVLNVLDFGAVGDGLVEDTQAIQNAFDQATNISASFSNNDEPISEIVVLFPAQHNFISGPLNITGDHMALQIDGNLTAITNETLGWEQSWPQILPLPSYGDSRDMGHYLQYQPFLSIFNSSNLILRGMGVINGRGQWWWDMTGKHNSHHPSTLKAGRPNLLRLVNCTHVEISGVTLQDSPFWCLHPVQCSHVHIHNVTIRSPLHAWNSDGVDPDSSQHVLIEYNDIGVGDDHIAIKAGVCGDGSPNDCHDEAWSSGVYTTKNVTVRYNTFRNGMGVALGSELSGGIQDVMVHDNIIGLCAHGFDPPPEGVCGWGHAMHLKTTLTRGGFLRNVQFVNNTIYNNTGFLLLEATYNADHPVPLPDYPTTKIQNITIQGNMGLGMASHASFHCSEKIVCEDIIVKQNVIGSAPATDWSCEYIDRYDVSDNFPPGLEECMYHSMNRTTPTASAMSSKIMAIFGALLVGAVSVSVCALLQGCRHRYIEISRIGTMELAQAETSTVPHQAQSGKGSLSTVQDDDDDDGLL